MNFWSIENANIVSVIVEVSLQCLPHEEDLATCHGTHLLKSRGQTVISDGNPHRLKFDFNSLLLSRSLHRDLQLY